MELAGNPGKASPEVPGYRAMGGAAGHQVCWPRDQGPVAGRPLHEECGLGGAGHDAGVSARGGDRLFWAFSDPADWHLPTSRPRR